MSASKPPLVVAVGEDDLPSRTALGRLPGAAGFEPVLFESAEAPGPLVIVTISRHEEVILERAQLATIERLCIDRGWRPRS